MNDEQESQLYLGIIEENAEIKDQLSHAQAWQVNKLGRSICLLILYFLLQFI